MSISRSVYSQRPDSPAASLALSSEAMQTLLDFGVTNAALPARLQSHQLLTLRALLVVAPVAVKTVPAVEQVEDEPAVTPPGSAGQVLIALKQSADRLERLVRAGLARKTAIQETEEDA